MIFTNIYFVKDPLTVDSENTSFQPATSKYICAKAGILNTDISYYSWRRI